MSNVTQVIKSVKVAEDDSKKSVRALESALESIGQSMQNFYNEDPDVPRTSPEDLLVVNRAIAEATSRAVAASNSRKQEDIVAVANTGRQVIGDLLKTLKVSPLVISSDFAPELFFAPVWNDITRTREQGRVKQLLFCVCCY